MTIGPGHYFPILKGKSGDLTGLAHVASTMRASLIPVIEAVSSAADTGDIALMESDMDTLAKRLADGWGTADRVILDCGLVGEDMPLSGGQMPAQVLAARAASRGLESIPAVRVTSPPAVLAAVASVASAQGYGACIRIEREDIDDISGIPPSLLATLAQLGLAPDQVDILLDFADVQPTTVGPFGALAVAIISSLPNLNDWRSVSLASGAFPPNLAGFNNYVPGTVQRSDAALWRAVAPRLSGARVPSFSDYVVSHPVLADTGPFRPPPQIRYTDTDEWHVLRGPRDHPDGNRVIFDLAAQFLAPSTTPFRGAAYSWGDEEIARWASATGGPGAGKEWVAVRSALHVTFVTDRLATLGAP